MDRGNPIRRAAELLYQAEKAGVIFEVQEGEVEFFTPSHQREALAGLLRQVKRWRAGIKKLLLAREGAAAENAIACWNSDSELRAAWPGGISDWLEREEANVEDLLDSIEEPRR